jgi:hypothetical protein
MPTLKVRFTGLCSFVRNDAGGMRVVLVNARDNVHGSMEPHTPAILVDLKDWNVSGRPISFQFDGRKARFGSQTMAAYELDKETISVSPSGVLQQVWPKLLRDCPTPNPRGDIESLRWMAEMKEVGAGVMLRTAYAGTKDVLAILDINTGDTLKTNSHAFHKGNGHIAKWQHTAPNGSTTGIPRALAEEIDWTFQIGASVTIGASKGNIDLTPKTGGPLLVWIVNQPPADLTADRSGPRRTPDVHFEAYYMLAKIKPSSTFIPNPLGPAQDCGRAPTEGATNPRCPVALFDSVEP